MKSIIKGVGVLVVVIAVAFFAYHFGATRSSEQPEDGLFLALADGKVQVSSDGHTWVDAGVGQKVAVGDSIRTGAGRAVVVFGDGSVARLDRDSEVYILSAGEVVKFENKEGRVYSRINPEAGLSWTVLSLGTNVSARGTAFTVACDQSKKELAVLVTESKVEVEVTKEDGTFKAEVAQGKELKVDLNKAVYESATTRDLQEEDLQKDEFVAWNLSEDEGSGEAELKLAYEGATSTVGNGDDDAQEVIPSDGQVATEDASNVASKTEAPAVRSGIVLSAVPTEKGVKFTWSVTNVSAPHGFKLTKSLEPNPYYPRDPYLYLSSPEARSATWEVADGKTWHFRVCTWNGGEGGESKCLVHSNDITVKTVAKTTEDKKNTVSFLPIANELVLSAIKAEGGVRLSWTASTAESFQGYKVVRSKDNPDPYYPHDGYLRYITTRSETTYLDSEQESAGSCYYRICALKSGETTVCGNVVKWVE